MTIALTLKNYMEKKGVSYQIIKHPHTLSSMETARVTHIPGGQVAKAVLLEDEGGYVMIAVPSTHRVELGALHRILQRRLGLATESEVATLFTDCAMGAIPPIGAAYGIETLWDDSLAEQPDVYFEAGNHEELIHVRGEQFQQLLSGAEHGRFSRRL